MAPVQVASVAGLPIVATWRAIAEAAVSSDHPRTDA